VELAICIAFFGMVSLMVLCVLKVLTRHDLYQQRLDMLKEPGIEVKTVRFHFHIKPLIKKISRLFATRSFTENIQLQLTSAGIPLKAEEYITLCLLLIILFPTLLYLLAQNLWLSIAMIIGGALAPSIYLKHKKDTRRQTFNQQMGDALIIMANALRAGFSFQQAMDTVRKELPPPVSAEFTWTLKEMNLGFSLEEALLNLGRRVGSSDLDMIISGIIIQRQIGGNLAQILENISATIRDRAQIKREVKVLTAQGRLSGLIIGILPIILMFIMLIINPEYFNIMITETIGKVLLFTAGILEIIGLIIIQAITNIDY